MSIGLAARRDETTVRTLLQLADTCLYQAKHLGRNRVVGRGASGPVSW
jgi:PleD family two-component response regulator